MPGFSKKIKIYTDGGSRGNPGPSAIGVVVLADGEVVHEISRAIGVTTNNVAEYQAVIDSLKWIAQLDEPDRPKEINWFLDSKLVVEQLSGRWKIKDEKMRQLATDIWQRLARLELKSSFNHVPREKNRSADALVNQALDSL